jgi:diguanylate cyclase (GGDEF)-like protein
VQQTEPKPTVLLIDDSADIHRLLAARLRHEHFELAGATTGAEGIAAAKAQRPSAILLDVDMPDMDGFQVIRALKSAPETSTVPVIFLSSNNDTEEKVTAFDLGAADFVIKSLTSPGELAELKARLRATLRLERLMRLLSERAELDGLTGLGNRIAFNRRWAEATSANKRHGHPLSLAVCDVDHFKRVNDTFGHPAGDEVLAGFAKLIAQSVRNTDVPCRFGGEEFVVIMPDTAPADAHIVAERIRSGLMALTWPRHPEHQVTVSIGIAGAEGPAGSTAPEQWLEAADKALYQAKHSGRNRVVLADPIGAGVPA